MQPTAEHFEYLDELRESGVTNMFGAGEYVEDEFGVSRDDARKILKAWMATYDGTSSVAARVARAKSEAA